MMLNNQAGLKNNGLKQFGQGLAAKGIAVLHDVGQQL
jgi:hypothetical protein